MTPNELFLVFSLWLNIRRNYLVNTNVLKSLLSADRQRQQQKRSHSQVRIVEMLQPPVNCNSQPVRSVLSGKDCQQIHAQHTRPADMKMGRRRSRVALWGTSCVFLKLTRNCSGVLTKDVLLLHDSILPYHRQTQESEASSQCCCDHPRLLRFR